MDSDEVHSSEITDEWVEVSEAEGGHAQVLTLWKVEDTPEGPRARPLLQAIRPKGGHGPLLLVA